MSDKVVSLARVRKAKARVEKSAGAAQNAVKFGRTKAQKSLENARAEKVAKTLDDHGRDT